MIRRTIRSALFLVIWLGIALSLGGVSQSAQVNAAQIKGEDARDFGGAGGGHYEFDVESNDVDGQKSAQAPMRGKTEKRVQKFVDEDGDGYNDRRPDAVPGGVAGAGNANAAKEKKNGKGAMGVENASEHGLKKGQDNNPGLGIEGALERGLKMGQNSNKGKTEGFANPDRSNDNSNVRNNGMNRFNRNFEKYNPPSKEKMGGGSGNNQ